jgi:hypothetical protein
VRIPYPHASPIGATSSTVYKLRKTSKPPSLPPGHPRRQKPHSQQKSLRAFRIFPYCRRLPSKNVACTRFRWAQKAGSRLDTVIPTSIITAAKTVRHDLPHMGRLHSRLGALIGGLEAVRPVLVTDPFHLPSTFRVHTFTPYSLAPDKLYPDNRTLSSWRWCFLSCLRVFFLFSFSLLLFGIADLAICSASILVYLFHLPLHPKFLQFSRLHSSAEALVLSLRRRWISICKQGFGIWYNFTK